MRYKHERHIRQIGARLRQLGANLPHVGVDECDVVPQLRAEAIDGARE
ncbi:MAG: hypothetical protein ACRDH7_04945 [Actinomycetota bacterium]